MLAQLKAIRWRVVLVSLAIVSSIAQGPFMLDGMAASTPPLRWIDNAVVLLAIPVMLLVVIGFQAAVLEFRRLIKFRFLMPTVNGVRLGCVFFEIAAIYFIAAGASALATSAVRGTVTPAATFALAMGIGTLTGARLARLLFRRQLDIVL